MSQIRGSGNLAAFLNARLDEDEAAAKAASGADWMQVLAWVTDSTRPSSEGARVAEADSVRTAIHIARHDPARVLREVEADRKLLDLYERAKSYRDQVFARPEPRSVSDEMRAVTQMMGLEQVLRLRAAVYSDHPDYRPYLALHD